MHLPGVPRQMLLLVVPKPNEAVVKQQEIWVFMDLYPGLWSISLSPGHGPALSKWTSGLGLHQCFARSYLDFKVPTKVLFPWLAAKLSLLWGDITGTPPIPPSC